MRICQVITFFTLLLADLFLFYPVIDVLLHISVHYPLIYFIANKIKMLLIYNLYCP
jgi:hypothetical protein